MTKIMNKRIWKRRIFLGLVLALIGVSGFATIPTQKGQAWLSNPARSWEREPLEGIGVFMFRDNYGAHDWIADSALRLLIDAGFGEEIEWLFLEEARKDVMIRDPDTGQDVAHDYDPLPLWDFDRGPHRSGLRPWWHRLHYTDFHDLSLPQWLMARRYGCFLHGTQFPDNLNMKAGFASVNGPPSEQANYYKPDWVGSMGASGHSCAFRKNLNKDDWEYFNHYGKDPAILALEAALDAIWYLNFRDLSTNEPAPKYEMAAYCLGAMTHFIADVAVAGHVTHHTSQGGAGGPLGTIINEDAQQWIGRSDSAWENWVCPHPSFPGVVGLVFDSGSRIAGGPRWGRSASESDPTEVNDIFSLTYSPMWPDVCVREMAYLTFTGYDKDLDQGDCSLGEFASVNLAALSEDFDKLKSDPDDPTQFFIGPEEAWPDPTAIGWTPYYLDVAEPNARVRVYETPEWAAYFCARAIRWVMERTNKPEFEDSLYDRMNPHIKGPRKTIPRVAWKVIRNWIEAGTKQESVEQWLRANAPKTVTQNTMSTSLALSSAVFVMGLVLLPSLLIVNPKKAEADEVSVGVLSNS